MLTLLSNVNRNFIGLQGITQMKTLIRKCEQHETSKSGLFLQADGYKNKDKGVNFHKNLQSGVIKVMCT